VYGVRRRRALLGAVLALVGAPTVFALAGHLLNDRRHALGGRARVPSHTQRGYGSAAVSWPAQGQAALVLGSGQPAATPDEQPVPIASLAKVMTAYLTLERYPLSGEQEGFTITVTGADVQAADQDAAQHQSVVAMQVGEQLAERQLLEALLIPSGNNVAQMLASVVAGSEPGFIAEMNAEASALGMDDTTYTDPSGFEPSTVSTAADQLRVFRRAMRFPIFRQIVSMASVTLPAAGTLTNFDPLISEGYAGKTGSDSAAGGCLAFFTQVALGGHQQTAVGVVLGQGQGSDTSALLAAAGEAAGQLVDSATDATPVNTVATPPFAGSGRTDAGRGGRQQLLAPGQPPAQN
jgi:serine-type D-Ala-D-Ala carboxypeptidase (penicillin-binding protein 5/6)